MYNGKFVSSIICAAGSSTRMNGAAGKSKQFLSFGGMTVIERTVLAFENDAVTDEMIVVCPEALMDDFKELLTALDLKKPLLFAKGGEERQMSVKNGVDMTSEKAELILVHDGARPFITPRLIEQVTADGDDYGCATLGVPVKDTIKKVWDGVVVDTPPRSELFAIQTPQAFRKKYYLKAYENAEAEGLVCSDDCRLIELYGGDVHITTGDYRNIKITTPEDIMVAQAMAGEGVDAGSACGTPENRP